VPSPASFAAALRDRYLIERELGRGGMATVFLARDLRIDRFVALKVLRPEFSVSLGAERFHQEIAFSARLQHPHILSIHDSGEAAGLLWYSMPYVEGESLRKRLAREPQLPLSDALRIAAEIADGLSSAHDHGIVHRDIKPENILLSGGEAMIADFGLARALDVASGERLTESGITLGTPAYMSPEQAAGDTRLDGRSDLYSLGCVLYEMLAGEPPFTGRTAQIIGARRLSDPVPSMRSLRDVSEAVEQVVLRVLARAPADRFTTAAEFGAALHNLMAEQRSQPVSEGSTSRRSPPRALLTGRRARLGVAAGAVLAVAAVFLPQWGSLPPAGSLDPRRIAVAPFDTYDPKLDLWSEGLMDILSANLDGAGALRTVSPSAVLRRWRGHSDTESAEALGLALRAGVAVVGRLVSAGPDSVRAVALVVDVARRAAVGELEVRESASRLDRLGDSLSLGVLRLLGESVGLGRERLSSLGAASLSALKAFLQGEQYLRRARWDSAAAWYAKATAVDSAFVLAHSRLKLAMSWETGLADSAGDGHALFAGSHNVGLPPRDSLLIVADSLQASLGAEDSLTWVRTRRLFATLGEAARRYPSDPFVWYRLGEVRYHLAPPLDYTTQDVIAAFDRAIALDSAFGPAYAIHSVELALILGDAPLARRYTDAYLRHVPADMADSATIITHLMLANPGEENVRAVIERTSPDVLYSVTLTLDMWFDSSETAVRLARAMVKMPSGTFSARERRMRLARILSVRGHLQEAGKQLLATTDPVEEPDGETIELFTELALVDAVPATASRRAFARWARTSPRGAIFSLPWYAARRDTAALRSGVRLAASVAASGPTPHGRELARYGTAAARAYLSLAVGDSAAAVGLFRALPDSLCPDCYFDWKTRGELLMAAGRLDEAERDLTRVLTYAWTVPTYPAALVLLGRLAELRGDKEKAARHYRTVLAAWSSADSAMLPERRRVEQSLKRVATHH
jgi:eukaryotic-like serine/threonine-protein kinase